MAWNTTLPLMVRHLINDYSEPYKYEDNRIAQSITIAGLISTQEYPFSTSYTFDIETPSISPDPTVTYDAIAIALFSLKAAAMLDMNSYQSAVKNGIRVKDGDSEVETTTGLRSYKDILDYGPAASYKQLLAKLGREKSMSLGKAVLSPASILDISVWGRSGVVDFFNNMLGGY